jgi:mono/diheme cytochrome c family protein
MSDRPSIARSHVLAALAALLLISLLLIVVFSRAAAAGSAREAVLGEGRQEYQESCTGCHGADGKGRGELADKLVMPPSDLTRLAAASGGVFPFWRTFEVVAGEAPVSGHDTHQMPQYLARMRSDEGKPGHLPAHARILALTHYLESLQGR